MEKPHDEQARDGELREAGKPESRRDHDWDVVLGDGPVIATT